MTSKEALQIIQDNLPPKLLGILQVEINIIKQDLERLEVLEKSSKDFQDRTLNIINTYKKAIEILKRFNFKVCENRIFTDSLMEYEEITQQEYELLKEVLEYE